MKKNRDWIKRLTRRYWPLIAAGIFLAAAMAVSVQGNFGGFDIDVGPGDFDSDFADWNESGRDTDAGSGSVQTSEGNETAQTSGETGAGSGINENGTEYLGGEISENTENDRNAENTGESGVVENKGGSSRTEENPDAGSAGDWTFTSPDSLQNTGEENDCENISSPTPVPFLTPTPEPETSPTPEPSSAPLVSPTSAPSAVWDSLEGQDMLLDTGALVPASCLKPAGLSVREWNNVLPGCLRINLAGDEILGIFSVRVNNTEAEWIRGDGCILIGIPDGRERNHLEIAYLSVKPRIFCVDESGKECYTIH